MPTFYVSILKQNYNSMGEFFTENFIYINCVEFNFEVTKKLTGSLAIPASNKIIKEITNNFMREKGYQGSMTFDFVYIENVLINFIPKFFKKEWN